MSEKEDIFNLKVMNLIDGIDELKNSDTEPTDSYGKSRNIWTTRIINMAKKVERVQYLAGLEVDAFSSRGMAVEEKHSYISMLTDMNKAYKLREADKLKGIIAAGKKYTAEQMKTVIAAEISELWAQIEHLKAHVDFMEETIKSIDNIIYGIKYRIEIQKYLDPTK